MLKIPKKIEKSTQKFLKIWKNSWKSRILKKTTQKLKKSQRIVDNSQILDKKYPKIKTNDTKLKKFPNIKKFKMVENSTKN